MKANPCCRKFPRWRRLHRAEEFRKTLRSRRQTGRWFVLHFAPNSTGVARLGIVVARRVAPRAIDRNAVRRIARERFRLMVPRLAAMDYVLRLSRLPMSTERELAACDVDRLLLESLA